MVKYGILRFLQRNDTIVFCILNILTNRTYSKFLAHTNLDSEDQRGQKIDIKTDN